MSSSILQNQQPPRPDASEPSWKKILRFVTSPRRIRRLQVGIAITLVVAGFVSVLNLLGILKPYEAGWADLFYRPHEPSGNVILIAVDDSTIDQYGWPLDRITHRGFLAALARSQPRVIVLDIVTPNPTEEDIILAPILNIAGPVVQSVLGIEETRAAANPSPFPAFDFVSAPLIFLRTPNTTLAHGMFSPDSDGAVRRVPIAIDAAGQRYPAIAFAAVALYQGREPQVVLQNTQALLGDRRIPVDAQGQMLTQYLRRGAIKTIPYTDITQGKADYGSLRNKIILVGPITQAVPENYAVPLTIAGARASNVELQADAIETLLSGNFLRAEDQTAQIISALIIAALAGLTLPHFRWLHATALTLTYLAAYLLYAYQRNDNGVVVTPLYATLALGAAFALAVVYRYFSEERARRFISRIFHGRIAPEAIPEVIELYNRGALALAGGRHEVTVLCATLRGISSLSEIGAPETVIDLLDKYSAAIIETIFQCGGSLTSQVGNTIVATWNFPLVQPDHATRATNAAFEIQRELERVRPASPENSDAGVGIGIATGAVVVGHLSALQADYSIVGDVVTLAERVTALASAGQVLVSPETRAQIGGVFDTRHIHSLRTRGKKDPIFVFEADEKSRN